MTRNMPLLLAPGVVLGEVADLLSEVRAVIFDFDGVFTDNTVYVDQNGVESVRCWRSDGLGLSKLRNIGLKTLIVSTEVNPVVTVRARKLKTECMQGVENKGHAITEWALSEEIPLVNIAFIGNDINDSAALRSVGVPIAVADAHTEILPLVRYRTHAPGGQGAVREVCDLIVNIKAARNIKGEE